MAEQQSERFPPSISVAKLYERTSQRGRSYMTGRMGSVKIAVLKTDETSDDGNPIWEMKFSAAPPRKDRPTGADLVPAEQSGFGRNVRPLREDEIPY